MVWKITLHPNSGHQTRFCTSTWHKPSLVPSCCEIDAHRFRVATPFNTHLQWCFSLLPLSTKLQPFFHLSPLRGWNPTFLVSLSNVNLQCCVGAKVQHENLFFLSCRHGVWSSISAKVQQQQLFFLSPLWSIDIFFLAYVKFRHFFFSPLWSSNIL